MVMTAARASVPVEPDNVPDVLKGMERWCVWKPELTSKGTYTKKPMQASWPTRGLSKTTPSQWRSFGAAMQAYRSREELGGIGFITGGGIVAIDIDSCVDEVTRELTPAAEAIVRFMGTYAEFSPSGTGVRLFVRGTLPEKNVTSKAAGYELYGEEAYVTVTGVRVPGTPAEVAEGGEELAELYAKAKRATADAKEERRAARKAKGTGNGLTGCPEKPEQVAGRLPTLSAPAGLTDEDLVGLAKSSKNGAAVAALLDGQWDGYASQSEAELALANHLAFYAGPGGAAQVESVMLASGLARDKMREGRGDGRTYLSLTVETAYEGRSEFYKPTAKKERKNGAAITLPGGAATAGPASLTDSSTQTDVGLARRLVLKANGTLRYVREQGRWLSWNGKQWLHDDGLAAAALAKQVTDELWKEFAALPHEKRASVLGFLRAASSSRGVEAAVKLARSEPGIPVATAELNRPVYLLNCGNGILDVENGKLLPHDPRHLLTHMAGVEFHEDAACPTWKKFVNDVMGDNAEEVAFLQRSFGLALTADVSEQVLWLHHGAGRNGKSTALTIMTELLGTYAGPAPLQMLLVRNQGSKEAETQFASLAGKRLVTCVETDDGVRFSEATVKLLTGGDVVLARKLYGDAWPMKPSWKLHVAANHKPVVRGTDEGIWRRLLLTPWLQRFDGTKEDKQLKEKLMSELPGILRWCVAGFMLWRGAGLQPPESVSAATRAYRGENDTIGLWLAECCVTSPDSAGEAGSLYASYRQWAESRGEYAMTAKALGQRLDERGLVSRRETSGRWRNRTMRYGIGLLAEHHDG